MEIKDIVALSITGVLGLVIVIMSIIMLTGRGADLIAGYNTLTEEEKNKFNTKALTRFIGGITLPIGLAFPTVALGGIFDLWWVPFLFVAFTLGLVIFAFIFINTGKRFRK